MPLGGIYVWLNHSDSMLSSQKLDFYFVRLHRQTVSCSDTDTVSCSGYIAPDYIIQKSKLSSSQVLFMERKRLETEKLENIFEILASLAESVGKRQGC